MTIKSTSPAGENFIYGKEGFVSRAYKDVGGVVTIGPGLTGLSRTFARYWKETRGRELRMGDILSRAEARKVFGMVLREEFVPPVVANIAPKEQHHMDGSVSVAYNAGAGSTKWKWAQALRSGNAKLAASLLLTTAITVGGTRVVKGLQNRRRAEARLIEFADYGAALPATEGKGDDSALSTSPEEIREYQAQLTKLGFYRGQIDGVAGDLTKGAVKNFQRAHGLRVDGKVGPATRAALARAVTEKGQNKNTLGGGALVGGGSFLQWDNPWLMLTVAGGTVLLLFVLFTLWNNRGVILRRRTPA